MFGLDRGGEALHRALSWLDARRGYRPGITALRELLPGDRRFGDPLSTAGTDPTQVVARRTWPGESGRFSVLRELGLAVLQVADWLSPGAARGPVAIAFTDLVGFSSWAVRAGDETSLDLLRSVDALVTAAFEAHKGMVVKRLGDGTMGVFEKPAAAAEACRDGIRAVRRIEEGGYRPRLRAGVHFGEPHAIGGDFIGMDVNIAARLCEAAGAEEILVSGAALRDDLDRARLRPEPERGPLRGAPHELEIYAFRDGLNPKAMPLDSEEETTSGTT